MDSLSVDYLSDPHRSILHTGNLISGQQGTCESICGKQIWQDHGPVGNEGLHVVSLWNRGRGISGGNEEKPVASGAVSGRRVNHIRFPGYAEWQLRGDYCI